MFIPNKTYQTIRTIVVGIIGLLMLVIVGLSVLYVKQSQENKIILNALTSRVDDFTATTHDDYRGMMSRQNGTDQEVLELKRTVARLQRQLNTTQSSVNMLMRDSVINKRVLEILP